MAAASGSDNLIQGDQEERAEVAVNYLVAANWGTFVEQQDARLCSRCQAFWDRWSRIAAKLLSKQSEIEASFEPRWTPWRVRQI